MAFSDSDILKLSGAVLAASVIDSNSSSQWFEKRLANNFIIDPETVWSDLPLMKDHYVSNFSEAVQKSNEYPEYFGRIGINSDGTFNDDTAIQMTPVAGTNNATYIAYNTYNDPSSGVQKGWIQPQLLPRPNGAASAAFQATIWIGKPSEGKPLLTSAGSDGNWVSHFWNPAGGVLLISPQDAPPSATIPSTTLYITGFYYTGNTGGGGGNTGDTVLLQAPDGSWRVRNDYPFLRLERREEDDAGDLVWNSYGNFGASVEVDGVRLSRPYAINVDLNADDLNDTAPINLRSAFKVSGTDQDFTYGNSQQQTVFETARGTELVRADAVREEVEFENRPLNDVEIVLDTTETPEAGSVTELAWFSNIDYDQDADFIRFNELGFEVLESLEAISPVRISVETVDGELIQENLPFSALNAGIDGGFNLELGYHLYNINPKYTDVRTATTITRMQLAKGHKVKLSGGNYDYLDPRDDTTYNQVVPRQKAKVEFINYVNVFDQSNFREEVYQNAGIMLDNGIHAYNRDFSNDVYPLASVCEHNQAYIPVLGNYEKVTYVASGDEGIVALFDDPTTRTQLWTDGDRKRLEDGAAPSSFIETDEFWIDLNGVFTKEMDVLNWDLVNAEYFLPLIRNDHGEDVGYRVSILSTIVDHQFQESQSRYEFADGKISQGFFVKPTLDAVEPSYTKLGLPRKRFSINRTTPRRIRFQFQKPIKLFGYYADPTDPADPIGTGTFIPSIKSEVTRVYEEPLVTGNDLEGRVDSIEGASEYNYSLDRNLPTLHLDDSLLTLADQDGEWLLWSDLDNLFSDQDIHQWLFQTGTEAYYQLDNTQGSFDANNTVFTFDTVVVHIPSDQVNTFEVSFGWDASFSSYNSLLYGKFKMYLDSSGRGFDNEINLNIPVNASVTWRFRRRRDGSYSYIATPMNDNLASVWLGEGNDLSDVIPVDPNPPFLT